MILLKGVPGVNAIGSNAVAATDIELAAVAQGYGAFLAGAFGLPNKSPNNFVGIGVDTNADMPFLSSFPYIGPPHSGHESVPPLATSH